MGTIHRCHRLDLRPTGYGIAVAGRMSGYQQEFVFSEVQDGHDSPLPQA